ncbi:hypothetical protein DFH09DRAFT_1093576 [Mycena vulgaris]|nr:hypothetical protein DFH09DRAFT_1093576 [Mycena vulgaris]
MGKRRRNSDKATHDGEEYNPSLTEASESRKRRRREASSVHYAKKLRFIFVHNHYSLNKHPSADKIREKRRIQMAEKRAAIKAKCRRSERDISQLETETETEAAEFLASQALCAMLKRKRAARIAAGRTAAGLMSPLPPSSDEDLMDGSNGEKHAGCAIDEQNAEQKLGRLRNRKRATQSPVAMGSMKSRHLGTTNFQFRKVSETSGHQQQPGRRRPIRLATPPSRSPTPEELQDRMPSFYDKLWAVVERP